MLELSVKTNIVNTNVYNTTNTLPAGTLFELRSSSLLLWPTCFFPPPVVIRIVDTTNQSASDFTHGTRIASCRPVKMFERLHPRRLLCLRQIRLIS